MKTDANPAADSYAGRRVTIMGLGLFGSGVAATRYFAERGARVTVTDLRREDVLRQSLRDIEDLDVRPVLGRHDETDFTGADLVLVNPAVRPGNAYVTAARAAGVPVEREIHLVMRLAHARGLRVFGVTGSNGKSTTTGLLASILRAHDPRTAVGGNIGRSLLNDIEHMRPGTPVVLELSSFQLAHLDEVGLAPHVSIVTNLSPNHLDWHGTFGHYAESKHKLIALQTPADTTVLNRDDEATWPWQRHCRGSLSSFGLELKAPDDLPPGRHYGLSGGQRQAFCEVLVDSCGPQRPLAVAPVDALHLIGRHNQINALAAVAAARTVGVSPADIETGLAAFRGLPHRLELVADANGVRYYNDSIATTPESVLCALEALPGPITLIAGGYDKGVSFAKLGAAIRFRVAQCYLMGPTAPAIARAIVSAGSNVPPRPRIQFVDSLQTAVARAAATTVPGDTVLLSPACASYDGFVNFAERGACFRAAVQRLTQSATLRPAVGAD